MHRIEQKRLMIVMIVIDGKIVFITGIVENCKDFAGKLSEKYSIMLSWENLNFPIGFKNAEKINI